MIKIVHIITRLDSGGSAQNTLLTCCVLSTRYEQVLAHGLSLESLMTAWEKNALDKRIQDAKNRGVRFRLVPALVQRIDPGQDVRAFFSIIKLLKKEKPAIVHTHTSKAGVLGRWAAKLAGVPIIIHTPHGHVFYGHFGPYLSKVFLLIEKVTALITDRMIALTDSEKRDYVRFSVSRPDRLATIHSGVDIERFRSSRVSPRTIKRALGLDTESLVIGTVGWLMPVKGSMYLLKAMKSVWQIHPGAQLVFAGKGDLEGDLRAEADRMNAADKITFLGWRDDIPEIMHIFDVFVLSSLNEGMGRVLIEAMAAGKPIVASRVGGIPDLVREGENGLLVAPRDSNGLSHAIRELLEDKQLREEMGRHGTIIAYNFSVEKMIEQLDSLYASLYQRGFHIEK